MWEEVVRNDHVKLDLQNTCANPENSVSGVLIFFSHHYTSTYFTEGPTDLLQEAIAHLLLEGGGGGGGGGP